MSGNFLLIYICNFHVLSHLLMIYICKLHWNLTQGTSFFFFMPFIQQLCSVLQLGESFSKSFRAEISRSSDYENKREKHNELLTRREEVNNF